MLKNNTNLIFYFWHFFFFNFQAVSILKNARTLDLVLKKGSGLDLFPGESSGYSSSSSVADEAVSQPPFKPKRLSIVSEEGDERSFRKSCQRQSAKSNLKSSGSIDSIFDNLTNGTSAYREKSKSIEILTDTNAKKTVTFQNEGNVSKTLINFTKPLPDSCRFIGSGQTLIQNDKVEPSKVEKQTGNGMISMERTEHNSKRTTPNDAGLNSGSFSSSCSLSSAISQEIQKRNEVSTTCWQWIQIIITKVINNKIINKRRVSSIIYL